MESVFGSIDVETGAREYEGYFLCIVALHRQTTVRMDWIVWEDTNHGLYSNHDEYNI